MSHMTLQKRDNRNVRYQELRGHFMKIKTASRKVVEKLVVHFGYEMRIAGSPPCGYAKFLRQLVNAGTNPRTVFDVGVGNGTPWLYAAFPQAHFVLIEPQQEFEPAMRAICAGMDAEYHVVGAGRSEKNLPIYRLTSSPTGSSFLPPNPRTDAVWGPSEKSEDALHVVPLDTYHALPGPFFLKIDTEGYELEVLNGARKILEKTEVVLMEVALTPRQVGEPDLVDIGTFMKNQGFHLINFPVLQQQAMDGHLLYVDAAFAKGRSERPIIS